MRRAENQSGIGDLHIQSFVLGQTEVDQSDLFVRAQHHVAGLQIAMQDASRMQCTQRARDLTGKSQRLRGRHASAHTATQIAVLENTPSPDKHDRPRHPVHRVERYSDDARAARSHIPAESARRPDPPESSRVRA
jgi:hypothetical protein